MNKTSCKVGVVGAGTVGAGVIDILLSRPEMLERRCGAKIELAMVADVNREAAINAGVPAELLVDDYRKLIENDDIDVVVELVGGMGIAEKIVHEALDAGKAVVTANKALLSEKGKPLFELAKEKGVPLAFEAAVAGGIPVILNMRDAFVANNITSIRSIVNGTCNYILTEMIGKGIAYEDCLAEAQKLGFAEADPTFDVEGIDSGHKLALMSALALETWIDFSKLHIEGISGMNLLDVRLAQELGYTVKLLAVARPCLEDGKLFLSVHPALLPLDHPLAAVQGSMNAVSLQGDIVQESISFGRGAGRYPTASAVVADIAGIAKAHAFGADVQAVSWAPQEKPAYELQPMEDYRTRYYLRFSVEDRCGVFGRIATILGDNNVGIASVIQHDNEGDFVPVVVVTHEAREGDLMKALGDINSMDFMRGDPACLRIEG